MDSVPDRAPGLWRGLGRGLVGDPRHGPLPAMLLALTVLTGVVDAVSILSLGRVFVANMTGNVVFVAFSLVGAPGFSLSASLSALAGFLLGALGGGEAIGKFAWSRAVLLRNAVSAELALLVLALAVSLVVGSPLGEAGKDSIAAITAGAMGLQNAAVRRLAVPDLTTTVLTMTLTGIAADIRDRKWAVTSRRLLAVAAMLVGAVCGAMLVLEVRPSAALGLAVGILALVAATSATVLRRPAGWQA